MQSWYCCSTSFTIIFKSCGTHLTARHVQASSETCNSAASSRAVLACDRNCRSWCRSFSTLPAMSSSCAPGKKGSEPVRRYDMGTGRSRRLNAPSCAICCVCARGGPSQFGAPHGSLKPLRSARLTAWKINCPQRNHTGAAK